MKTGGTRLFGFGLAATLSAVLGSSAGCDAIDVHRPPLTVVEAPEPTPTPTPTPTPAAAACWTDKLPPEPQPPAPTLAFDDACRLAANAQSWTFPTTWTGTNGQRNDSHNGDIVGRWVTCGESEVPGLPTAIEFGGNGRWRALARDASGALVPASPAQSGYFYALGNSQLNVTAESSGDAGLNISWAKFADGNRDVLGLESSFGEPRTIYARTAASPANGGDNLPSLSLGGCSMVGDWDVPANTAYPEAPASTWSFDGFGNFVVGPRGAVSCDAHTMHGTYRLSADEAGFQLTSNWNLGLCDWWFTGGWPATFDASCAHLTLKRQWDNCTGGRGYLNGDPTILTRR